MCSSSACATHTAGGNVTSEDPFFNYNPSTAVSATVTLTVTNNDLVDSVDIVFNNTTPSSTITIQANNSDTFTFFVTDPSSSATVNATSNTVPNITYTVSMVFCN